MWYRSNEKLPQFADVSAPYFILPPYIDMPLPLFLGSFQPLFFLDLFWARTELVLEIDA